MKTQQQLWTQGDAQAERSAQAKCYNAWTHGNRVWSGLQDDTKIQYRANMIILFIQMMYPHVMYPTTRGEPTVALHPVKCAHTKSLNSTLSQDTLIYNLVVPC